VTVAAARADIQSVEASSANKSAEVNATMRMIERVEQTFAMKPQRLVSDE
jgi:hypothetical protein